GHRKIKFWDVASGANTATLDAAEGEKDWPTSVAFSPDGKLLAWGSYDDTVKLWDLAGRRKIATLEGHQHTVQCVAFSPDGRTLASGSHDNTVKLWNVASREPIGTLAGHDDTTQS